MSHMNDPRLEKRLEKDAEDILEQDMYRRRWQAKDRDAIALRLHAIIKREHGKQRGPVAAERP